MVTEYYEDSSDEEVQEFRDRNEAARRAREQARRYLFTEDVDDADNMRARQVARDVSNRISDEYEEALSKSKEQDRKTMEYIDHLLKQTSIPYSRQRKRTVPVARGCRFASQSRFDGPHEDGWSNRTQNDTKNVVDINFRRPTADRRSEQTAREKVRQIEAHLDGILDYEIPSADNFKNMRNSLRDIHDKMSTHRILLNRRTDYGQDDEYDKKKVSERIDEKYRELEERMPCLSGSERDRNRQTRSSQFDPNLIAGYATGLSITDSGQTAELRGRIRMLLCRTRKAPESDEAHTKSARRRREASAN